MPPKTSRRHKQGAESSERVLEAALAIAAERGYDGMTMALVTERSGIPPSSVYWHFKNKDALMAAVLEFSFDRWRAAEDDFESRDRGDLRTRYIHRFERVRRGVVDRPEFWRLGLMLALLSGREDLAARRRFLEIRQDTLNAGLTWVEAVLGADAAAHHPQLPALLTQIYMAAADGLFLAGSIEPDWDFAQITDALGRAIGEVAARWAAEPPLRRTKPSPFPDRPAPRSAPEDSRERILWATSAVAAEHGYVGTTISRVCAISSLPVSSVYWYFADKDALLGAVVESSWGDWLEHQPKWQPAHGPAERDTVLRQVLLEGTRSFVSAPDFLRVGHSVSLARVQDSTAAKAFFVSVRRQSEDSIAQWFATSLNGPEAAQDLALGRLIARIIIAVTDGLFLAEQIDSWEWDLEALIDLFVDIIEEIVAQQGARITTPAKET